MMRGLLNMRRRAITEEMLSAYVDGTLDAVTRARVEQALEESAELRAKVEALRATVELLKSADRIRAPRSFALSPAVAYGPARPLGAKALTPWVPAIAATAAAIAFGLLLVGNLTGTLRQSGPGVGEVRETARFEGEKSTREVPQLGAVPATVPAGDAAAPVEAGQEAAPAEAGEKVVEKPVAAPDRSGVPADAKATPSGTSVSEAARAAATPTRVPEATATSAPAAAAAVSEAAAPTPVPGTATPVLPSPLATTPVPAPAGPAGAAGAAGPQGPAGPAGTAAPAAGLDQAPGTVLPTPSTDSGYRIAAVAPAEQARGTASAVLPQLEHAAIGEQPRREAAEPTEQGVSLPLWQLELGFGVAAAALGLGALLLLRNRRRA